MSEAPPITAKPPTCPECGSAMIALYGGGWDYDRWLCGDRLCQHEIELKTSSFFKPKGVDHETR
jgi:ribosomal protein S27AE